MEKILNRGTAASLLLLPFLLLVFVSCSQYYLNAERGAHLSSSYYVANDGDDLDDGSFITPFQTVNHALTVAGPGDTVFLREGVYTEKVHFTNSGSVGAYLTLKAYGSENAVISGDGLTVSGHEALVRLNSVSWVSVVGLEIRDFKTSNGGHMVDGILIDGLSSHILVENNHIHHIENNASPSVGREGHAIHVLGNGIDPITHVRIHENIVHDNNTGTSENITVNGYVSDFEIVKNKVYNAENIAICVAGGYAGNTNPAINFARNGVVSDNQIWNIDGRTGPVPVLQTIAGTIGIYIDGARQIVIERNRIWDSDRAIGLVSENNDFPTQFCIVRNNFIFSNRAEGILMGGYSGFTGGGTVGCLIVNNTLYHNAAELGFFGEEVGEIRLNTNCNYNEIHNNIVFPRPDRGTMIRKSDTTGSYNGIDYNLYFSTGGTTRWFWNGTEHNTFVNWKGNSGGDSNSMFDDPQFVSVSPLDLHLQTGSPAVDAGLNGHGTAAGSTDIDGQARYNSVIDIGADELH